MNKDEFATFLAVTTPDIISKIMDKYNLSEDEASSLFHKSKLYQMLEEEKTKVWHYSSEMIVELLDREQKGNLIFPEV